MADRFSRGSARGLPSRTRRQSSWAVGPLGLVSRSSSGVSLFATSAQAQANGLTIVRLRGELLVMVTAGASVLDGFEGAFGICIVSENAFGAGVGSVPSPIADIGWDGWFAYQMFQVKVVTATIGEGVNAPSAVARYEIDSKAMRKFKATDTVIAILEVTEVGAATLAAQFRSRILVKIA